MSEFVDYKPVSGASKNVNTEEKVRPILDSIHACCRPTVLYARIITVKLRSNVYENLFP